jgi:proteasome accessory factor B
VTDKKAERLMNLTICLLVARNFVPKSRIRQAVEAYRDLGEDAFERKFDRDKEELRILGVPIEVGPVVRGFEDEVGYRIRRDMFELPEISLEADEAAVVGLAARVWQHARLASATTQGLRKLRAGGVEVDETALAIIEPQLATDEPAFDAVFAAVTQQRELEFEYRGTRDEAPARRQLQPWGIVSWHGHWYVVGHDLDRAAARMFRVSRIVGSPEVAERTFVRPEGVDLRKLAASLAPPEPQGTATVRVRHGSGEVLRRRARQVRPVDEAWVEIELPYGSASSLADELVSFGPDVVVLGPDEVRSGVVRRLAAVAGGGVR